jgi:cell division protein ZapA
MKVGDLIFRNIGTGFGYWINETLTTGLDSSEELNLTSDNRQPAVIFKVKTRIRDMQALIPINIVIADRSFRIRIKPEDEGAVRGTLKTINDKIIEFKTQFAGKDMQDYVSMVILWYATQNLPVSGNEASTDFLETLGKMEEQLDKVLS